MPLNGTTATATKSEALHILVIYSSIDGVRKSRTFATLTGARRWAQGWIGQDAELGRSYAVSFDGVGKIEVAGSVPIADLFGEMPRGWVVGREYGPHAWNHDFLLETTAAGSTACALSRFRAARYATQAEATRMCAIAQGLTPVCVDGRPIRWFVSALVAGQPNEPIEGDGGFAMAQERSQ